MNPESRQLMHHDVHHDEKDHGQCVSHNFTISNGAGQIGSNLHKTLETHWNKHHLHRNLSSSHMVFVRMGIHFCVYTDINS